MPWNQYIGSELRADILAGKAVPALSAGFTSGLGLLVSHIAFGTFIFSGPLAPLPPRVSVWSCSEASLPA